MAEHTQWSGYCLFHIHTHTAATFAYKRMHHMKQRQVSDSWNIEWPSQRMLLKQFVGQKSLVDGCATDQPTKWANENHTEQANGLFLPWKRCDEEEALFSIWLNWVKAKCDWPLNSNCSRTGKENEEQKKTHVWHKNCLHGRECLKKNRIVIECVCMQHSSSVNTSGVVLFIQSSRRLQIFHIFREQQYHAKNATNVRE